MIRALLLAVPLAALVFAGTDTRANAADENPLFTLIKSKVKDEKKPFALLVTFKVKAGNEKKFEEAFAPCLTATRKEPGCVAYYLNRDPDAPTTYIMYEHFKGIPALDAHMKEKHTQTLLATVVQVVVGRSVPSVSSSDRWCRKPSSGATLTTARSVTSGIGWRIWPSHPRNDRGVPRNPASRN